MKKTIKIEQPHAVRKGTYQSTQLSVFKHPTDKKASIPPLFKVQYNLTEIDLERIKELTSMNIEYELNS